MVECNISEQEIRAAGAKAEVIEDYPQDKYSPSALLLGFTTAGRPLHFQVSFGESDLTKIITFMSLTRKSGLNTGNGGNHV